MFIHIPLKPQFGSISKRTTGGFPVEVAGGVHVSIQIQLPQGSSVLTCLLRYTTVLEAETLSMFAVLDAL